jgi:SAM-dependent methyltransferase
VEEWFRSWFGPLYEELYSHRDPSEAALQVASLLSWTGPLAGRVLDAGCGAGRHLGHLRESGLSACGIDLSSHLLSRAVQGDRGPVVRADLRLPPFRAGTFELVASFFTVFGYLDTARDDENLFRILVSLVSPDGWLYQDLPNPSHVRSHLVPRDEREVEGGTVVQERRLEGDLVVKTVTLHRGGHPSEQYLERVRLWELSDMDRLSTALGLERVAVFGDASGSPGTGSSPRQAILWRRA